MGNVYIAVKILFDGLGIDYVIPPLNNKEALYLGSKYSPDEICLPFKLMIGNYIAGIKNGADLPFSLWEAAGHAVWRVSRASA